MTHRGGDTLKVLCITGLGSGFAPFASGTWGSLTAVGLFLIGWWLLALLAVPIFLVDVLFGLATLGAVLLAVAWGDWAIGRYGEDPAEFTLDEFVGQWIALLVLPPIAHTSPTALLMVIGSQFVLFRAFDVWKPFPGRQLERLPGGWGIVLDDVFAGLYANLLGQLVWRAEVPGGLV